MLSKSAWVTGSGSAAKARRRSAFCWAKTRPGAPSPRTCEREVRSSGPIQNTGRRTGGSAPSARQTTAASRPHSRTMTASPSRSAWARLSALEMQD